MSPAPACRRGRRPHLASMNATQPISSGGDLTVTYLLAQLLERLERSSEPVGAEQYRSVVLHLVDELNDAPSDGSFSALLDAFPATAQVYENLNYRHAGLCRSPLEPALSAELRAREAIERVMRRAKEDPIHGQG
jgi:hypothetical protein